MKDLLLQLAVRIDLGSGPGQVDNVPTTGGNDILYNALNIAYFVAGVIAVIVIIVAGINYASSGGDSAKVSKAKNQILFAIIGIILILSAFAITNFITGRF